MADATQSQTSMSPAARRAEAREPGRGRGATRPTQIPKAGWLDVLWRVKDEISRDHVLLIGAGVAFYGLLAIFPAISALMAVTGLLYEPAELVAALEGVTAVVPPDVSEMLLEQAKAVAGSETGGLTLGLVISLGLALWSASAGVGSLMEGINVAYDERETRGFVKLKAITLGLTLCMILGVVLAGLLAIGIPIALSFLTWSPTMETLVRWLAYVPMALIVLVGIGVLYRFGPDRDAARWRWLTPGAVLALMLWLIASVGFSIYVENFASYNETFGSLAGVIVVLMWMWLSAVVILIGAEVNSELEAQTARDTTTGPREPMGHRGAVKADTLGTAR